MSSTLAQRPTGLRPTGTGPLKVVITGGRAVGKAMFVRAASELPEVRPVAAPILEYGRRGAVHLYGMPPQERYWFMWDGLARGAVAALVLAHTHRLSDCFPALDYLEARGLPHLVAVADPAGRGEDEVRDALAVEAGTPVVLTDPAGVAPAAPELLDMVVRHATGRATTGSAA